MAIFAYAHMGKWPMGVSPNLVVWLYGKMGILPHLGTISFTTITTNTSITASKYAYSYITTI